ncbi:MAG TPA: phage tail tape measure protein [Paludibacter sp.]
MQNEQATSTVLLNGEQAKSELTALAQKAQNLKARLVEANEAGDGKAFEKLSKELRQTQKEMKQMTKESFDLKRVLDNLSGASMRDLTRAKKELDKQLNSPAIERNSKEWKKLRDQLVDVKTEMSNLNNENKVGESGFSRMANGINKYFAMFTAGLAAVTGLTLGLKKFMDARNELEDSKANLKALTGLGDSDIEWLTDQAKMLSSEMTKAGVRVRASAKEIVDAFTIVGSAKPELLKDRDGLKEVTEAALVLATASKMEVVDSAKAVTIALNMYGASAKEAAKYTNVLGAGAKEGAAEVSSQTESILKSGVAAARAKIPIEQLVGSIQALADKGIKDEIAGTGLKTFFIKLQSGAKETNPAIVGLQTALENLQKQHLSSAEIQKRFGLETFTVAAAMIDSAKKVDFYTKAVTGTNVAWEQAAINSNTVAAKVAQAQNAFNLAGQELVKNLNPALLHATDFGVAFLKMLVQTPKWLAENKGLLATLATTMVVYTVAVTGNTIAKKANDIATKALDSSTVKFFKTLLTNPYVAIGAILAGVTIAIYKFATAQTEAQKAWKQFNAESQQQSIELNNVFEAYKRANEGTSEKSRLLKIIKEQYGPYIQNLIDEKGNITDIEKAQTQANTALREQIALKIKNAAVNEITTKEVEKQSEIFGSMRDEIAKQKGDAIANVVTQEIGRIFSSGKDMNKAFKEAFSFMQKYGIDAMNNKGLFSGSLTDDLRDLGTSFYRLSAGTRAIENQFVGIIKSASTAADIANGGTGTDTNNDAAGNPEDKAALQKKKVNQALQKLENDHLKKLTEIKQQYVDGEITSEFDYNQAMQDQQEKYDKNQLRVLRKFLNDKSITDLSLRLELNQKIGEIEKRALDRTIDQQNKLRKILLDADPIEAEKQSYENRLKELGLFGLKKELMTKEEKEAFELLETQHNENLRKLSTKEAVIKLRQIEKDQQDAETVLGKEREQGLWNEQQYKDKLLEIEIEFLKKKLKIQGLSANEIDKITKQLTQHSIQQMDKNAQEMSSFMERYGLDEVNRFKTQKALELKLLQDYLKKGILSEKDAARVRAVLASEEFRKKTKDIVAFAEEAGKITANFSNAFQGFQQAEEEAITNKYQVEIDAASKAGKDTTKIEEQKNKELAELRAENADAMFALQVASIIASTAVSAIDAYASALKVPGIGLVLAPIAAGAAVLYGASQVAVAEAAREKAKAGYFAGGYTGGSDPSEVRGYFPDGSPYHGKEYVADHVATANQPLRKVFNMIEYAKKTNTVARITDEDIIRTVSGKSGYYDGGYHSTATSGANQTTTIDLSAINATMQAMNATNAALVAELQKGIKAKYKISGNDGVVQGIDQYNKLIKNAKG